MKTQLRRGSVMLSVAAAAALAACASDGEDVTDDNGGGTGASTGDGDGDGSSGGSTGGDGDGDSAGGSAAGGSSSGGASSGGAGSGGDGSGGMNLGGMGGDGSGGTSSGGNGSGGSDPGPTSMTVEEACPLERSAYGSYTDDTPYPTGDYRPFDRYSYSEIPITALNEGTENNDRLTIETQSGHHCLVAGDGDDILEVDFEQKGNTPGTSSQVTLSGGTGADVFAIQLYGENQWTDSDNHFTIKDFEPGVDTLYVDTHGLQGGDWAPVEVFVQDFDGNPANAPAANRALVVSSTDGKVYYTTNSEGGAALEIGLIENPAGITTNDIEIGSAAPECDDYESGQVEDRRAFSKEILPSVFTSAEAVINLSRTYLLASEGDAIRTDSATSGACIAGQSGDDIIQLSYPAASIAYPGTVSGGPGADTFVFHSGANPGVTRVEIIDFTPGEDTLALSVALGIASTSNPIFSKTNYDGSTAGPAGFVYDETDGQLWVSNGETASFITTLKGAPTLTAEDFLIEED